MKTADEIANLKDRSNAAVARMGGTIEKLNALIEKLENDTSRSRGYIVDAVKAERELALPLLSADVKLIRELWTEAAAQKRFWESRSLILSQQVFDADPAKDAAIKLGRRVEFAEMPVPLLQLTWEDARAEGNLAQLWLLYATGQRMTDANRDLLGVIDMTLDGVEIPGQAAALAAISVCHSNLEHAEMITAVASGLRNDPVRKLHVGRLQRDSSRLVAAADAVQSAAEQAAEQAAAERSQ